MSEGPLLGEAAILTKAYVWIHYLDVCSQSWLQEAGELPPRTVAPLSPPLLLTRDRTAPAGRGRTQVTGGALPGTHQDFHAWDSAKTSQSDNQSPQNAKPCSGFCFLQQRENPRLPFNCLFRKTKYYSVSKNASLALCHCRYKEHILYKPHCWTKLGRKFSFDCFYLFF